MPAVTLNTRTDLNTSKAKLGTFELTTSLRMTHAR